MPAAGEWSGLPLTSMGVLMRVDIVTLTTASAAALTIGLASPAFGAGAPASAPRAVVGHIVPAQESAHRLVLARDGDGDGDGDVRGDLDQRGCGGDFCGGFIHRHCGSPACFRGFHRGLFRHGLFRHGGPFVFGGAGCGIGCGGWGGGGGDVSGVAANESGAEAAPPERRPVTHRRPAAPMRARRQVAVVPSRAVPTGFGGSQGSKMPLGIAGLSLLLGGAGLLVVRRRLRASARS